MLAVRISSAHALVLDSDEQTIRQRSSPAGIRSYKPDVWGTQRITIINSWNDSVEVVSGGYSGGNSLTRYSCHVHVPARAARIIRIPMQPTTSEGEQKLSWHPFLYTIENGDRILLRASDDYMIDAESLPQPSGPVTVVITDWKFDDDQSIDSSTELAVVFRLAAGYGRNLTDLDSDAVPLRTSGLEAVDHIVLASDRISESPAVLASVRSWVQKGGRLWIMLDQVELSTVKQLLGDVVDVTEVDRIRLTELQLYNRAKAAPAGRPRQFDYPVDFVRVITEKMTVIHEVNGWPASLVTDFMEGEVLLTTLSDRGWIRRRSPKEYSNDLNLNSHFIAEQALEELAVHFTRRMDPPPMISEEFEPFLSATVGYSIPSRGTILTVLGVFCVGLLGAGMQLQRNPSARDDQGIRAPGAADESGGQPIIGHRLERLAVIGPVLALVAAAPIVLLGERARSALPARASIVELVRVGDDNTSVCSTGTACVFIPELATVDIYAQNNRLLQPKRRRLEGTARQMVWTDLDNWHWEDLTLTSGLQFFATQQTATADQPIRATATFGPKGLTGRLDCGPYSDPEDVIIASTTEHALAVTLQEDGQFVSGVDDLLEEGIYIRGNLLSDEQRQRHATYQTLLAPRTEHRYPKQPLLLAWTHPGDTNLTFPEELTVSCSSLLAIPVELRRTPPDTEVFIPSPMLPYEPVSTAEGTKTTAYDARTRKWIRTSFPTATILRFDLPDSVLPLKLSRAVVHFRILAAGRTVSVAVGQPDSLTTLRSIENAVHSYKCSIEEPAALQLDENGSYYIRLTVSDLKMKQSDDVRDIQIDQSWVMDFIRLEMFGRTAAAAIETEGDL